MCFIYKMWKNRSPLPTLSKVPQPKLISAHCLLYSTVLNSKISDWQCKTVTEFLVFFPWYNPNCGLLPCTTANLSNLKESWSKISDTDRRNPVISLRLMSIQKWFCIPTTKLKTLRDSIPSWHVNQPVNTNVSVTDRNSFHTITWPELRTMPGI